MFKINIRLLSRVDILIFDQLLKIDLKKKIHYFKQEIYLVYLFKSLIFCLFALKFDNFFKNVKYYYYYYFYKALNPKIAIGNEIDLRIFEFKKMFSEKIAIAFQMSLYRSEYRFLTYKRLKKYKIDYFLTYDKWHTRYFNFFNTNFIEAGSVKANNNQFDSNLKKIKEYDIMFISSYRKKSQIDPISYYYLSSNLSSVNNYIAFKKISEFAKKNKKKLVVALASNRKEKKKDFSKFDEINYFKSINNNFFYENKNSFEIADKSNLIISNDSTLGVELLYLGHKVLFLNSFSFLGSTHLFENKKQDGPIWISNSHLLGLEKKINKLLKNNNIQYEKTLEREKIKKYYDYNNTKLKKIIEKYV